MRLQDENFDVIYTNAKVDRDEWRTFEVGQTRFNDDALRRAGKYLIHFISSLILRLLPGESVIQSIRERQPTYNLITNNCQTYVLQLLDAIKVGGHKDFGTTAAVYERIFGPGKIMDLFEGDEQAQQQEQEQIDAGGQQKPNTVNFAQNVMDQNTTQLDTEREMERHEDEKKKGGFFSNLKSKSKSWSFSKKDKDKD